MKKLLTSVLLVVAILALSVFFTACQPEEQPCGHLNATEDVVDPTCVSEGYTEHICLDCGYVYHDSFVEPSNELHEYIPISHVPATCTDEGLYEVMCVYCGNIETDTEKMIDHEFGDWTTVKATTCTELGYEERTCKGCGLVETKEATKTLNHNYVHHVITLPTCTEEGYTMSLCADCGLVYKTATAPLAEHTYDAGKVIDPTCAEEGYTLFTCTYCGYEHKDLYTPVIDHKFGDWMVTVEPTCENGGEEARVCEDCLYLDTKHVVGHDYKVTTHAPTCDNPGYDAHICEKCGHSYADNYVEAPGHAFGDWYAVEGTDNVKRRDCECGHYEIMTVPVEG